jgi:hypothetical protein
MRLELPQLDNEKTVSTFNDVLVRLSDEVFTGREVYRRGRIKNKANPPQLLKLSDILPYEGSDMNFKKSYAIVFFIPESFEKKQPLVNIEYRPQYFQGQAYNEHFPLMAVGVYKISKEKKHGDTLDIEEILRQFDMTPRTVDTFKKREIQATLKAK